MKIQYLSSDFVSFSTIFFTTTSRKIMLNMHKLPVFDDSEILMPKQYFFMGFPNKKYRSYTKKYKNIESQLDNIGIFSHIYFPVASENDL